MSDYTLTTEQRIEKVARNLNGAMNCLRRAEMSFADEYLDAAREWIDCRSSFGGHYLPADVRYRGETLICAIAELLSSR